MIDQMRFARVAGSALWLGQREFLEPGILRFRAGLSDIDLNLHVTNSKYLRLMDLGRFDLFLRGGIARAAWKLGSGPVVGASAIRFKAEIRPAEAFELHSKIIGWDDKWFYCDQRFRTDGRDRAVGVVKFLLHKRGNKAPTGKVLSAISLGKTESPMDEVSIARWADANGL